MSKRCEHGISHKKRVLRKDLHWNSQSASEGCAAGELFAHEGSASAGGDAEADRLHHRQGSFESKEDTFIFHIKLC